MFLDDDCKVVNDPNGDERVALKVVREAGRRVTSSAGA
jgi:hypothetical protein